MKISVVMATYNGEEYLIEQLNSLRDQSIPADEVLFFDDGSQDCTVKILNDYIADFHLENSWKVTVNEKNLGYADNFHKAMTAAHGDYIFFSDQDDVWCRDKIEKTIDVMDQHPEIKLLCSDYEPFACADNAPSVPPKIMKRMRNDGSLEKIDLCSRNIHIASLGCVMCIRKKFRDEIEPYWKKGWAHDDFVWKLAECADGCYEYHRALIKRRLHDHNVSMRKMHDLQTRMNFFQGLLVSHTQMYRYAEDHDLTDCDMKLIQRFMKADKLRMELVGEKKYMNVFKLLAYTDCYQSKKSILMEPYIALKSKYRITRCKSR